MSVEELEDGPSVEREVKHTKPQGLVGKEAFFEALFPKPYADCSRQLINNIERKALVKVRRLLKKKGLSGDLAEALRG